MEILVGGNNANDGSRKNKRMKTVSLWAALSASAGAANALVSYTLTTAGKITSILWIVDGIAATATTSWAELSMNSSVQFANDGVGLLSQCANSVGTVRTQNTVMHAGFQIPVSVGDRLYLHGYNQGAITSGNVRCLITIM